MSTRGLPVRPRLGTRLAVPSGPWLRRVRVGGGALATLAIIATLLLAACHQEPPLPGNASPDKAVTTNLNLTAKGDFDALMRNRLPPDAYSAWRAEWTTAHAHPLPASVAQQKQFATIMQMLTEPGAEEKLATRLQPLLKRMRGKRPNLPILAGILKATGTQMLANSPQLAPAQRAMAQQGFAALLGWLETTDLSDPGKARRAIALVCATARGLNVKTLADWRALDHAHTMQAYGALWTGLEKLLGIYGLDLAGSLTNAKVTTLSHDDKQATVKLDMTLAGKPITGQWTLVAQGGHWYDAALLDAWHKAHPPASASTAAPAATAAPASSAGRAATVGTPPASGSPPATPASTSKPVAARSGSR